MVQRTTERGTGGGAYSLDATFSALADGDRRRLVGYLLAEPSEPVAREELAAVLAGATHDKPIDAVTDDERHELEVALHHEHFPILAAADMIEEDGEDAVVLADHPAWQDPGIVEVLEGDAPASEASIDALFQSLANVRRRTILHVLSHQFGHIHVETLARELEARERGTCESEVPVEAIGPVLAQLHHDDLPHLSEAGLVERDAEAGTVAYTGHPVLRVPWMHSVLQPDFRRSITGESEPDGIGEIQGRKQVISFGQSLCDRADEELFCMFTDTKLLEAGCLTRIRDAAGERDVDVYLGTRDPTVRAYVEENAPEVVLWEANTDWLNLPVAGDRVGRLLVADREAVMLGTLMESKTEGLHEEQSIIGEGEGNTLVTMISQLIGPHLEEIDQGTENIEARLPL